MPCLMMITRPLSYYCCAGRTRCTLCRWLVLSITIRNLLKYSLFFFQAEDGIRDDLVTGVQTCALPIYKWDLAQAQRRAAREGDIPKPNEEIESAERYRKIIAEGLKFIPYAPIVFASAKTGYHVQSLLETVLGIADMRFLRISTSRLNEAVQDAVRRHNPTVNRGKVLKIYYATQARVNPPTFVFFVNDPQALHFSYERYLENQLRAAFDFKGTGIRMYFRARPKSEA